MAQPTATPAVEGWFAEDPPALVAQTCAQCGTTVFPPTASTCPNPGCRSDELGSRALAATGTVWSWSTNHYEPPPPFIAPDPFEPYTILAVELDGEGVTVLGQLDPATDVAELRVGLPVEVTIGTLFSDASGDRSMYRFRPREAQA